MAAVDIRRVNFYLPLDFRPNMQRTSLQMQHRGSVSATAKSLRNKAESTLNVQESLSLWSF
jgi:hypothetical protein